MEVRSAHRGRAIIPTVNASCRESWRRYRRVDGRGAREAGIGTVCLLRGGKDPDPALDAALEAGHAHHVLDSPLDVIDILASRLTPRS